MLTVFRIRIISLLSKFMQKKGQLVVFSPVKLSAHIYTYSWLCPYVCWFIGSFVRDGNGSGSHMRTLPDVL